MNDIIEDVSRVMQEPQKHDVMRRMIELGNWMGRREAFSLMAGRCAAADVECLRRMRDEKAYRELDCTWEEFCTNHLKVSRKSVDRLIGRLEELGPAYFHLTNLTHITIGEYRQIAASVSEAGVELDGSVVTLLPENSQKLAAAIAQLLERENRSEGPKLLEAGPVEPEEAKQTPPELSPAERIVEACGVIRAIIADLRKLEYREMTNATSAILKLYEAAKLSGLFLFPGL